MQEKNESLNQLKNVVKMLTEMKLLIMALRIVMKKYAILVQYTQY